MLARFVAKLLSFATQAGLPRDILLEAAGLGDQDLSDPDTRVPFSKFVALWQCIARASHPSDPEFGIRWGASLQLHDWGLLGYAMSYSETLGAALRRLVRYSPILADGLELRLHEPDAHRRVAISVSDVAVGGSLPYAIDGRLAALLSACREMTRVQVIPHEVTFAYAQPSTIAERRSFFRCALRFAQPVSKVVLFERDLCLPVVRGDETLAGYLSAYAEQVLRSLVTGASTTELVRSAIWALLSEGRPTLDHIAAALHVPPRTLQRRLSNEGTSLQQEVEHIRRSMAMATLKDRALTIDDVAFLLGYTEPSTFYHSFKRWTGITPHQYRTAAA